MTNQIERPRIFSMMTKSRFLHLEDALTPMAPDKPGKIRFFIGAYQRGSGQPAETAHHFLDDADARVLFADIAWGKPVDLVDYKGSINGSQPVSRVLKVKGPTDKGKYWFQVANGPGEIIGQGAVKPKGKAEVEISIALSLWEARKLALAVQEYMTAFRVATIIGDSREDPGNGDRPQNPPAAPPGQDPRQDLDDLFGPEPSGIQTSSPPASPQKPEAKEKPANDPPTFYALANEAIKAGLLDKVQALIKGPESWAEKTAALKATMVQAATPA